MTDADVCGAYLMLDRNEDELHEVPEVTMKELYGFFLIQIIDTGGLQIFGLICRILQEQCQPDGLDRELLSWVASRKLMKNMTRFKH